jgi:hypothetical protein
MEDRKLSEKESLEIISEMILNTQKRIVKKAGIPFLVFGYLTVLTTIAVWVGLEQTGSYFCHYFWFIIPIAGYPVMRIFSKKYPKEVYTYVDRVVAYIWCICGIVGIGASVIAFFIRIPILFIILLVMSMGTALTGLVTRFKLLVFSGFLGILLAFGSFIVQHTFQLLFFGLAFVFMMIIPGHIMNYKAEKQCLEN